MDPNTDVVVTSAFVVDASGERAQVVLDGDRRITFDPEDPRARSLAQVVAQLQRTGRPVYFEVDATTAVVRSVRLPLVGRVASVNRGPDRLEFELDTSHAVHVLPLGEPGRRRPNGC